MAPLPNDCGDEPVEKRKAAPRGFPTEQVSPADVSHHTSHIPPGLLQRRMRTGLTELRKGAALKERRRGRRWRGKAAAKGKRKPARRMN